MVLEEGQKTSAINCHAAAASLGDCINEVVGLYDLLLDAHFPNVRSRSVHSLVVADPVQETGCLGMAARVRRSGETKSADEALLRLITQ